MFLGGGVSDGRSGYEVGILEDELSKMILEGVLAELKIIPATARLASAVVTLNSSKINFHTRDAAIRFEEAEHKYILDPGTPMERVFPISVSGLWGQYFEKFDPLAVTSKYFSKWAENPESNYYGMISYYRRAGEGDVEIAQRIRDGWSEKGLIASAEGTRMHRNIELALGGLMYDGSSKEMGMFNNFVKEWLEPRGWCVYRLEWSIYCSTAMVAGQIDALFVGNGAYHMVDWKRCGKLLDVFAGAAFARYGLYPFQDCLDNACNHYFLQQNLYAVILERCYEIRLASMWLCQIHPCYESYRVVQVPDMRNRAGWILDMYARSPSICMPWQSAAV